jgi:phosphatidylglycerophosphatase A
MTPISPFPRPPRELVLKTPEHLIAFGFGAGLAPKAPGTAGTVVGLLFFALLCWLPWQAYAVATLLLFVFGCWVCGESARLLGVHDYGGIVFDEIVGFLIAALPLMLWPPASAFGWLGGLVAAFALFRLFDVWKPWPIRLLDRHVHGGFGIMVDDALAGLFSMAALAGLRHLSIP